MLLQRSKVGSLKILKSKRGKVVGFIFAQPVTSFFDSCENEQPLRHFKYGKYIVDTHKKHQKAVIEAAEQTIKSRIPKKNKLCLIFDRWSDSGTYYLAIYASYGKNV